ncbi:signal transduction histidine kinase [Streptosporangium becharense]|uniref:histidine kinase n=1 Tax=Streptosporangium becharense TaxID=1816182 RepID=A0A7W9IG36_9ACTN|nr:nitrate- and nitrite sensing domain-containing protein [Streptosporangium becharense]MBB2908885.1 signal transduction histidine kinase [Streptosporangium becharense]MBB5820097.1 signal transduction histidine kinase [Streptosporangium becharense]
MASSRSIRFKLSMLLAIPLTSLVAIWGFATVVTVGDSLSLLTVDRLYRSIGAAAADLSTALQREHVLSAEYLATRSRADRDTLAGQRVVSDQARTRLRRQTSADDVQSSMSAEMRARYAELMKHVDAIGTVRAKVDEGRIGPVGLSQEFALVPEALHRLYVTVSLGEDLPLYQQSRGVTMISQAKDLLSRERALATGTLALGQPMKDDELRLFARLAANRTFLMDQALSELEPELRAPFAELTGSPLYDRFTGLESRLLGGSAVSLAEWRTAGDDLDASYQRSLTGAGLALTERAAPLATATFVRAGVAGVLGLLAVVASLLVSYRIGSGLIRELAGLRRAAADLAEVRLPKIMERLRRGERADVAAEAPELEPLGSTAEVHDVAMAFDSVRRSAVDAAVEQARLRDGVAQAFRNLARRSQSLLQRQLKLLDGMQTQAEDPEALENLFLLDHLTTRMRRHAEGLVILSGGASGRRWRSAVHMEDVLRGATAQVENYARVRILPMGGTTLAGNAVADMMHLFAEIIENATVFSPPGSQVSVRGEPVSGGFAVEIEDRGLGLTAEKRAAINERLARPQEFDPAETDRLGFAVVGLLAARYKVEVTLRSSPYGGTGVVVLLPEELLGDPEQIGPQDPPHLTVLPELPESSAAPEDTAPAAPPAVPIPADLWRPTRRGGGLPRRVRQANLPPRPAEESPGAEAEERSPEEARALMTALQSGWRRGRAEDGDGDDG